MFALSPRGTYPQYCRCNSHNGGSNKKLRCLYDACDTTLSSAKITKDDLLETLMTVILQQKLDSKTWLNRVEFNNDSEIFPLCTEFVKFLDLYAKHPG